MQVVNGDGDINNFGQRAAETTLNWQEKVSCADADTKGSLIFSYVHDDGVLQGSELHRQIMADAVPKSLRHSDMSLAVRADAAGKVQPNLFNRSLFKGTFSMSEQARLLPTRVLQLWHAR